MGPAWDVVARVGLCSVLVCGWCWKMRPVPVVWVRVVVVVLVVCV